MDWMKNLNTAFKAVQDGYNAADNAVGGLLPGGVKPDIPALAGEVARDLLPGRRVHGATLAKRGASASSHIANNNAASAVSSIQGARQGGKLRETVVENVRDEAIESGLRTLATRLPQRVATGATGVGTGVAIADTAQDAANIYSGVLEATTGRDLTSHANTYRAQNPNANPAPQLFPYPNRVGDGSIHELRQGRPDHPLEELNNRMRHAGEVFDPVRGEWGVSEILYGR